MLRKLLVATALAVGVAGTAQATVFTFGASGTGTNGAESAAATITPSTNALTVALNSLQANPTAAGQEVSDIEIMLGDTPTSASLAGSSGTLIDIAPGGAVTPYTGSITHWGVALSGATITLATAGTGSVGGNPTDLLIGPGPYTNANSSITGRNPEIQGTGTFDLAAMGITSNTMITGVTFSFGTAPDSFLPGTLITTTPTPSPIIPVPVPEPSSMALLGTGLIGLGLLALRKRA
jgi:hypothetical protein